MSNFYNAKILEGIPKCRCYIPIEINYSAEIAYYIASKHGTDFILYLPDMDVLSEKHKRQEIDAIFQNIMVEVLSDRSIDSKIDGNDVLYKHNNKYKKFSGSLYRLWEIDSTIDKNDLDFEVIDRLCYKLGYTLRHDNFDEEDLLFERGHKRMTDKDWYLYGNKDGFT